MQVSYLRLLLKTMRPKQWVKNGVLFAALVFDRQMNPAHMEAVIRTLAGFIIFCLLSGLVYIINDIADIEADRKHPDKCKRPIASGALPVNVALVAAVILPLVILPVAYALSPIFTLVGLVYLLLNLVYSKWIKHIVLLDVLSIAAFFVLRVAAGVV